MPQDSNQPQFPALSDAELRETLDLMATAVASMSDRIDTLTAAAEKQIKLSTEARIAAFAAKDQTDPKRYGELIGQTVEDHIAESLRTLHQASNDVLRGNQRSNASFQETTTTHSSTLSLLDELRGKQQRDRRWLPWVDGSVCCSSGPWPDRDAAPFHGKHRLHLCHSWSNLDRNVYWRRCLCLL